MKNNLLNEFLLRALASGIKKAGKASAKASAAMPRTASELPKGALDDDDDENCDCGKCKSCKKKSFAQKMKDAGERGYRQGGTDNLRKGN